MGFMMVSRVFGLGFGGVCDGILGFYGFGICKG